PRGPKTQADGPWVLAKGLAPRPLASLVWPVRYPRGVSDTSGVPSSVPRVMEEYDAAFSPGFPCRHSPGDGCAFRRAAESDLDRPAAPDGPGLRLGGIDRAGRTSPDRQAALHAVVVRCRCLLPDRRTEEQQRRSGPPAPGQSPVLEGRRSRAR